MRHEFSRTIHCDMKKYPRYLWVQDKIPHSVKFRVTGGAFSSLQWCAIQGIWALFSINHKTYNKICPELRGNYRVILLLQPAGKLWLSWNNVSPTANSSPRLLSTHHPVATCPPAHLLVAPEKYQKAYFDFFFKPWTAKWAATEVQAWL